MDVSSLGALDDSKNLMPFGGASGGFGTHVLSGGASSYFKSIQKRMQYMEAEQASSNEI